MGPSGQWVVAGLLVGLGLIILVALARAVYEMFRYGPMTYLRHAFRMDTEGWRLIGILLLLAMAAAMLFTQWA